MKKCEVCRVKPCGLAILKEGGNVFHFEYFVCTICGRPDLRVAQREREAEISASLSRLLK